MAGSSPEGKIEESTPNRLCQIAYELALLAALLALLLAPLHQSATYHADVSRTLTAQAGSFRVPPGSSVSAGDSFPVYRFFALARTQLGIAKIDRVDRDVAVFTFTPDRPDLALGRHGTIQDVSKGIASVDVGASLNLAAGDSLRVFDGRQDVGRVSLIQTGGESSLGVVAEQSAPLRPGMIVSEFTVPTQVVIFNSPALAAGEIAAICIVLVSVAMYWMVKRRSPFEPCGRALRIGLDRISRPGSRLVWNCLIGLPLSWLVAAFLARLVPHLARALTSVFGGDLMRSVPAMEVSLGRAVPYLAGAIAAFYLAVLFVTREAPLLLLWRKISFNGGPLRWVPDGVARDVVTWLLHLVIAYAFASSLFVFVAVDLGDALAAGWPGSGVTVQGNLSITEPSQTWELIRSATVGLGYMATHPPHFASVEGIFIVARDVLFTLTIFGCLFGYGHSILGFLWGKQIRNLDFTIPGWLTNALCYGPLLWVVVEQIVPPLVGRDPIFGSGPLYYFGLGSELFLNIVYTLTIWNLGKMFGVMTDKGVRRTGFYSVVRHPSYTTEALMFLMVYLKGLTTGAQWAAALMFPLLYWLRSEREDNFMTHSNPEYTPYAAGVRWKFIPGLY